MKMPMLWRQSAAFFRMHFNRGLQYRTAALAGVATQFAWGFMKIKVFIAFSDNPSADFPMGLDQLASYFWLQQAFIAFFMAWMMEAEIFDCISDGNVAYELCRPVRLYAMWFSRSLAVRLVRGVLRCGPILLAALLMPPPYRLTLPPDPLTALWFLLTMALGLLVMVALCMILYMLTFFTISPMGLRLVFVCAVEFLQGAVIPLPFFSPVMQKVLELLPFAATENVPLRVYSGQLAGVGLLRAAALQVFWLAVLVTAGQLLSRLAIRKTTIQGG